MKFLALFIALAGLLGACASVPESLAALTWQDQRGDRGQQVKQRDLVWCLAAVETRRSLQEQCMSERGWVLAK
jgi:starvation-inducible outer membrane lipoprotein